MKTCLVREPPLSTNPPISEQFFHDSPLCPNFKNQKPPLILRGVAELCNIYNIYVIYT